MTTALNPLRQALTEGMRFWEPRRIVYNLVLAAVVFAHAALAFTGPGLDVTIDTCLLLFLLCVLANVAYCAAYLLEIPAQLSGFQQEWLKVRPFIFGIGLLFAAILAHYFSAGLLRPAQ